MLRFSEYLEAEIANILTFPSPSYFIQVFRKYKGLLRENIWKDHNYTGIRLTGYGNQAASKEPVSLGNHSRAKSAGSADP